VLVIRIGTPGNYGVNAKLIFDEFANHGNAFRKLYTGPFAATNGTADQNLETKVPPFGQLRSGGL
jgi:hypothetical protein